MNPWRWAVNPWRWLVKLWCHAFCGDPWDPDAIEKAWGEMGEYLQSRLSSLEHVEAWIAAHEAPVTMVVLPRGVVEFRSPERLLFRITISTGVDRAHWVFVSHFRPLSRVVREQLLDIFGAARTTFLPNGLSLAA